MNEFTLSGLAGQQSTLNRYALNQLEKLVHTSGDENTNNYSNSNAKNRLESNTNYLLTPSVRNELAAKAAATRAEMGTTASITTTTTSIAEADSCEHIPIDEIQHYLSLLPRSIPRVYVGGLVVFEFFISRSALIDMDDSNIENNTNITETQWYWSMGQVTELDDHHAVITEWRCDGPNGDNAAVLETLHMEEANMTNYLAEHQGKVGTLRSDLGGLRAANESTLDLAHVSGVEVKKNLTHIDLSSLRLLLGNYNMQRQSNTSPSESTSSSSSLYNYAQLATTPFPRILHAVLSLLHQQMYNLPVTRSTWNDLLHNVSDEKELLQDMVSFDVHKQINQVSYDAIQQTILSGKHASDTIVQYYNVWTNYNHNVCNNTALEPNGDPIYNYSNINNTSERGINTNNNNAERSYISKAANEERLANILFSDSVSRQWPPATRYTVKTLLDWFLTQLYIYETMQKCQSTQSRLDTLQRKLTAHVDSIKSLTHKLRRVREKIKYYQTPSPSEPNSLSCCAFTSFAYYNRLQHEHRENVKNRSSNNTKNHLSAKDKAKHQFARNTELHNQYNELLTNPWKANEGKNDDNEEDWTSTAAPTRTIMRSSIIQTLNVSPDAEMIVLDKKDLNEIAIRSAMHRPELIIALQHLLHAQKLHDTLATERERASCYNTLATRGVGESTNRLSPETDVLNDDDDDNNISKSNDKHKKHKKKKNTNNNADVPSPFCRIKPQMSENSRGLSNDDEQEEEQEEEEEPESTINELTKQLNDARETIAAYEKELQVRRDALAEKQIKAEALDEERTKIAQESEAKDAELEELRACNDSLGAELRELEQANKELEKELQQFSADRDDSRGNHTAVLSAHEDEVVQLERQITKLSNDKNELIQKCNEYDAQEHNAQEREAYLHNLQRDLENDNKRIAQELEELRNHSNELERQLVFAETRANALEKSKEDALNELEEKNTAKLSKEHEVNERLKRDIDTLKAAKLEAEKNSRDAANKLKQMEKQLNDNERQHSALSGKYVAANDEKSKLSKDLREEKTNNREAQRQLKKECDDAKKQLERQTKRNDEIGEQLRQTREKCAELQATLMAKESEIKLLGEQLQNAQDRLADTASVLAANAEERVAVAQRQTNELRKAAEELQAQLRSASEEQARNRKAEEQRVLDTQREMDELNTLVAQLKDDANILHAELSDRIQHGNTMKEANDNLQKQNAELQRALGIKDNEIETLLEQGRILQEQVKQLQSELESEKNNNSVKNAISDENDHLQRVNELGATCDALDKENKTLTHAAEVLLHKVNITDVDNNNNNNYEEQQFMSVGKSLLQQEMLDRLLYEHERNENLLLMQWCWRQMLLEFYSEEHIQPIRNKQESNSHTRPDLNKDDSYSNENNNNNYNEEEIHRLAEELDRVHEEYTDTLQKLEESMAMVKLARDSETEMREQLRSSEDEVEILARELECLQMELRKKNNNSSGAAGRESCPVKESHNTMADNDTKSVDIIAGDRNIHYEHQNASLLNKVANDELQSSEENEPSQQEKMMNTSKESENAMHNASFTSTSSSLSSSSSSSSLSSSAAGQLPELNEEEVKDIAEIMALEQQRQLRKVQPDASLDSPIVETPTSNEYGSNPNANEYQQQEEDELQIQTLNRSLSNKAIKSNSSPEVKAMSQSKEPRARSSEQEEEQNRENNVNLLPQSIRVSRDRSNTSKKRETEEELEHLREHFERVKREKEALLQELDAEVRTHRQDVQALHRHIDECHSRSTSRTR